MAAFVQKVTTSIPKVIAGTQKALVPKIQTFVKYAKVELKPPSPSEWPEIRAGFTKLVTAAKNGHWKNTTVKESVVNTCIALEVTLWFFLGEIIGKRSLVGYQVPGGTDFGVHM